MTAQAETIRHALDRLLAQDRYELPAVDAAHVALGELEAALEAIARNAEAWHGNGEDGPRRALDVIAGWARDPSSVPPGVDA